MTETTRIEKIMRYLKDHKEIRFTGQEIGKWLFETYPEMVEKKRQKTTQASLKNDDDALIRQLGNEIYPAWQQSIKDKSGSDNYSGRFLSTLGRPRKYYYSELDDEQEIAQAESLLTASNAEQENQIKSEADLYEILKELLREGEFLRGIKLYPKRIDEKKSSNTRGPNGNKWLHPDLVAMEVLFNKKWDEAIQNLHKNYNAKRVDIWAFEVKSRINSTNLRESFFQAVSNASWANYGYLVADEISADANTEEELKMLCNLHGIGVILLKTESAGESSIFIPADYRNDIDWNIANRLASQNTDFKEFIQLISDFYDSGRNQIPQNGWEDKPEAIKDN